MSYPGAKSKGESLSHAIFSAECAPEITILDERESIWGSLDGITESGEVIIADIGGVQVALPIPSAILEPLVGQVVIVGLVDGRYRVGRCSHEL